LIEFAVEVAHHPIIVEGKHDMRQIRRVGDERWPVGLASDESGKRLGRL
jgi:5S rRNA maturation endonuclease (ribonuclease M5)